MACWSLPGSALSAPIRLAARAHFVVGRSVIVFRLAARHVRGRHYGVHARVVFMGWLLVPSSWDRHRGVVACVVVMGSSSSSWGGDLCCWLSLILRKYFGCCCMERNGTPPACPPPPADAGQQGEICDMWLNGPEQWKEHIECNKHRPRGSSRAREEPKPATTR